MNAPLKTRLNLRRASIVGISVIFGLAGPASAALIAPLGPVPQVPTPYCGFIGLTWQNIQPVPAPAPGMVMVHSFGIGVYRSRDNGAWTRIALLPPTQTQYTVDPIARGVSYRFRLRLEPSTGFYMINHQRQFLGLPPLPASDFTSPFQNPTDEISYAPLATPSILTAFAILPTYIEVTWQETEPAPVSSVVKVMRKNLVNNSYTEIGQYNVAAPATNYPAINLEPNTRYGFQVKLVDAQGNSSAWSNIRDRATLAQTPTSLKAMLAPNGIVHLSWKDHLQNSGIQVHFSPLIGFTQMDGNPNVAGVNNFPAEIPGVAVATPIPNANVHFTICAVNLDGVAGPFVSPATITAGPNLIATRTIVRNNSQLPLSSLRYDDQEMVAPGRTIPAGGTCTVVDFAGAHTLHASGFNSMCNRNTMEFPAAGVNHAFTQQSNIPNPISIPSITLRTALAQSGGLFEAVDGYGDWYAFSANGTWSYGLNDSVQEIGTFSGSYSPGISTVNMSSAGGPFSAVFNECDGSLTIPVWAFNPQTQQWEEVEIVYARE